MITIAWSIHVAMQLKGHLLAALPLGGALFWWSGSAPAAAAGAGLSVLIDGDHLLDYFILKGKTFRLGSFFSDYNTNRVQRLIVILHSWELWLASAWLFWAWLGPVWAISLSGGWLYHMVWDQVSNRVGWAFYFFYYRARRGFLRSRLACPQSAAYSQRRIP